MTTAEEQPLLEEEESEKQEYMLKATGKGLRTFNIVGGIILIVSGILLIILGLAAPSTTITLQSVTLFRTGALNSSVDAFPAGQISILDNLNITFLQGFVQIFGGIGLLFLAFFFKKMLDEIAYGGDGYLWGGFWIALILYNVVLAIRCGMQDLTLLFFVGTAYFAIIGIFMLGDQLNQLFYRNAMKKLGHGRFSYAFLVIAIVISIVVWGLEFTALAFTVIGGAPLIIIVTPIVAAVLYIVFLLFVGLHYGGVGFIEQTYSRDLWLCVIVFVTILIIPWLDLIIFAATPSL
jgi:hypothetical protein